LVYVHAVRVFKVERIAWRKGVSDFSFFAKAVTSFPVDEIETFWEEVEGVVCAKDDVFSAMTD
jgi:hypothetical protein